MENNEQLTKQQLKNRKKKEAAKRKKQQQQEHENTLQNEVTHAKEQDVVTAVVDTQPDAAASDNFEEELCWCVQQIELGLRTQKPTKDQVAKSKQLITQLRSNKTPKPKKRMLMKTNFGNYRETMTKELQKATTAIPAKIIEVDEDAMKKSIFVKKKVNDLPTQASSSPSTNNNEMFCFNFPDPTT